MSTLQRESFLIAVGCGMAISEAAELVGLPPSTLYRLKRTDQDFAHDWDAALEVSLDQADARLFEIALTGDAGSMATVRANEILQRTRRRSERKDLAMTLSTTDRDGRPQSITVRSSTPLPD